MLIQLLSQDRPVDVQDNRGWRPLHEAAFYNQLTCLETLLQQEETDKNWRTFEGETAVYLACLQGHVEILRKLLCYGADLNLCTHEGSAPLLAAARCPSLRCTQLLLQNGAKIQCQDWTGWGALHEAAKNGSLVVTRCLLEHGARIDVRDDNDITPIFTAAEFGHLDVLDYLLQKSAFQSVIDRCAVDGATPLMLAAQCGHLACVKLLLEKGANANIRTIDGVMAVHLATQFDNQRCVELLLNYMSSETLDNFKTKECDNSVHSILHTSVEWERPDILDLLLSKGLNVDIVASNANFRKDADYLPFALSANFTPLGLAARHHYVDIMRKLIAAGSKVHCCTKDVRAPLTAAILSNNIGAVKLLLESGAVRTCASCVRHHNSSLEATFVAIYQNNIPVLVLLLKLGVNFNACWEDDPNHLGEVTLLSVLTEGNCSTPDDYRSVLSVLLDHITYTNFNKLLRKLISHFKECVEMIELLKAILETPHSLQHLCRVVVRTRIPLGDCRAETILKQLYVPETVCSYVLHKC